MAWYSYSGGWWNNASYTFNYGEDGDVLQLPNGAQNVWRRDGTVYFEVDGGNLALQLGKSVGNNGSYIKYTFDGNNIYRADIADYAANWNYYDPRVTYYHFYNDDSSKLFVIGDIINETGYNVFLNDDTMRAKTLGIMFDNGYDFVLFGNSLDNYIIDKSGNSQLWGGGGNDTLTGGGGADVFYFGWGNGYDTILDASDDDTIVLYNVNSWDFDFNNGVRFDYWENKAVLTLYDGSTLDIYASSGGYPYPIYQFADGKRYFYTGGGWLDWSYDAAEDIVEETASSPLWGEVNTFYGTNDADNFFLGKSDGKDLVFDAAQNDTIHLYDTALSDIVATSVNGNAITVNFSTGETAQVNATENISPTFKLASGESYIYNRENSSWQQV